MSERGQANVVGVALLLAVVVVALTTLTASIGAVVEQNAAAADARRVAAGFDAALEPVEATGRHRGRVAFTEGRLRAVERDLRVLDDDGVVRRVRVGGLVFEAGDRRVAYVAGAVVSGTGEGADLYAVPPITASAGADVLVVGAPRLGDDVPTVSARGGTSVSLRTRVEHDRETLGESDYRIAVETTTPVPWREFFRARGATVSTRDVDADGTTSVVGRFPGERRGYLVVHDLHLSVGGIDADGESLVGDTDDAREGET